MTLTWLMLAALCLQPPAAKGDAAKTDAAKEAPADKEAEKSAEKLAAEFDKDVPTVVKLRAIAAEPYRVRIWLTIADHPRVTPGLRQGVVEEIHAASERYLGSAWQIDYADPPPDAPMSPDAPVEDMPDVKKLGAAYAKVDKVLWADVSVDSSRPGVPPFVVVVREYDQEFDRWGPAVRRVLAPDDSLPVNIFRLLHRQFRAVIGVIGLASEQKMLRVVVKGAALQSPDSPFPLLAFGAPVKIVRDVPLKKGTIIKRFEVPWTYLIYEQADADRRSGTCKVMSTLLTPVDNGMLRRSKVIGLAASNTEDAETEVQFVAYTNDNMPGDPPGKRPVAGYEVLLRIQNQVTPVVAGTTDRRGRITLSSSRLDPTGQNKPQVCEILLRIGRIPVANFPLVPGDEPRREVIVNADPLLPEVSGRISALEQEIVDTLARQAILTKRLDTIQKTIRKQEKEADEADKAAVAKLRNIAEELNGLPGNDYFQKKLAEIKADALKRSEKEYKQKTLGKQANKLIGGVDDLLKKRVIGVKVNVSGGSVEQVDAPAK